MSKPPSPAAAPFTVIELIAVLSILVILVSIVLPTLTDGPDKSAIGPGNPTPPSRTKP